MCVPVGDLEDAKELKILAIIPALHEKTVPKEPGQYPDNTTSADAMNKHPWCWSWLPAVTPAAPGLTTTHGSYPKPLT